MKHILTLMKEYRNLNNRFGFLSCFDYPKEYEAMDTLNNQIYNEAEKFTNDKDITVNAFTTVLNNITTDIDNNEIDADSIVFYEQDAFIFYLTKSMTRKESERFADMLAWMDEKSRKGYLETRFIFEFENDRNNKLSFYYDQRMSFVVTAINTGDKD
ncbi:hypothetical protein BSK59_13085 [Paenibacillus odorifer]|uniref:hypothetical protein n=1 Tax=Paenibacillus odorifer TaxID=189426 RepID=UPI000970203F|nr:hypothetical protein [Paenibacillus odorifer]OME55407.1 hypothetical protein BSK59_13085 [Paenibacillus odorifer]